MTSFPSSWICRLVPCGEAFFVSLCCSPGLASAVSSKLYISRHIQAKKGGTVALPYPISVFVTALLYVFIQLGHLLLSTIVGGMGLSVECGGPSPSAACTQVSVLCDYG